MGLSNGGAQWEGMGKTPYFLVSLVSLLLAQKRGEGKEEGFKKGRERGFAEVKVKNVLPGFEEV